jgi:hypothetical protein
MPGIPGKLGGGRLPTPGGGNGRPPGGGNGRPLGGMGGMPLAPGGKGGMGGIPRPPGGAVEYSQHFIYHGVVGVRANVRGRPWGNWPGGAPGMPGNGGGTPVRKFILVKLLYCVSIRARV